MLHLVSSGAQIDLVRYTDNHVSAAATATSGVRDRRHRAALAPLYQTLPCVSQELTHRMVPLIVTHY